MVLLTGRYTGQMVPLSFFLLCRIETDDSDEESDSDDEDFDDEYENDKDDDDKDDETSSVLEHLLREENQPTAETAV
jgi:hypothetical protein